MVYIFNNTPRYLNGIVNTTTFTELNTSVKKSRNKCFCRYNVSVCMYKWVTLLKYIFIIYIFLYTYIRCVFKKAGASFEAIIIKIKVSAQLIGHTEGLTEIDTQ